MKLFKSKSKQIIEACQDIRVIVAESQNTIADTQSLISDMQKGVKLMQDNIQAMQENYKESRQEYLKISERNIELLNEIKLFLDDKEGVTE